MSKLIQDLLMYTRLELKTDKYKKEQVSLSGIARIRMRRYGADP